MKIAFITGCLEPGRDGVGDYTRSLAAECARRGHEVRLLAVGDRCDVDEPGAMPVRRRTREAALGDDGREARRWLEAFGPDWACLQCVPYSFEPRGWFSGEVPALAALLAAAPRRQIFFHETWIGARRGAAWLERLDGWRQRVAVRALWRRAAPTLAHTSTDYYRAMLARIGVPAERLQMFGCVPRGNGVASELPGVAREALVCGMFGTLHPNWQPEPFLGEFAALAQAAGRPAGLVAAGGLGAGRELFVRLRDEWRGRLTLVALGRMEPAELAGVFARCDFAVTSVPWNLMGKSSSAAALREFGLRVVVTNAGEPLRGVATPGEDAAEDEGFVPYFRDRGLLASALTKTTPRAGVEAVAERFLAALEARR